MGRSRVQSDGGSRISILPVSTLLLATAAMAVDAARLDFRSILKHCRILAAADSPVTVFVPISLSFSLFPLQVCFLSLIADFHHVVVRWSNFCIGASNSSANLPGETLRLRKFDDSRYAQHAYVSDSLANDVFNAIRNVPRNIFFGTEIDLPRRSIITVLEKDVV